METIEPTKEGEPDGLVPKDSPSSFFYFLKSSMYSTFLLRSMLGTTFPL